MRKTIAIILVTLVTLAFCSFFACSDSPAKGVEKYYTVTFREEGYADIVITVKEGEGLAEKDFPPVSVKKGYCAEWEKTDLSEVTGNVVVKAIFTPNVYKIELETDGGRAEDKYLYVKYGSEFVLPVPVKEYCKFLGWYCEDGSEFVKNVYDEPANIRLVAKWKETQKWSHLY